jgi:2-polyprenyl-3-methyl-5-hydroxy-6-metoxy-1,4-benzoquinol methylase
VTHVRNAPSPVVAGNVYDKYGTRNPVARLLMREFDRGMKSLLAMTRDVASILEVGCGEGEVTKKLADLFPGAEVMGTDVSPEIIAEARARHPDLQFEACSVYELDASRKFDLVVASEVFEHLRDPARALRSVVSVTRSYVFVSVPREPLWRIANCARGKYIRGLGNTPGHVQHWSTPGFKRFLSDEMEVVAVRKPVMWTQVLCRPRSR